MAALLRQKLESSSIGIACILHILVFGVYFFELLVILPKLYGDTNSHFCRLLHVSAGTWILFNVVASFWKFALVDSCVDRNFDSTFKTSGWTYCKHCEANIPPRAYHCRACDVCVLVRDHHCVFGSNCVGYKSRRYFILMNFYFWFALLYANCFNMSLMLDQFYSLQYESLMTMTFPLYAWWSGYADGESLLIALFTTLCVVSFIYASAVLFFHLNNTFQGRTTHEVKKKISFSYNLGLIRNLEHALGMNWKTAWISPFLSSPLPGTGYSSEENTSLSHSKKIS